LESYLITKTVVMKSPVWSWLLKIFIEEH
jgi:hypothetical protein